MSLPGVEEGSVITDFNVFGVETHEGSRHFSLTGFRDEMKGPSPIQVPSRIAGVMVMTISERHVGVLSLDKDPRPCESMVCACSISNGVLR